MPLLSAFFWLLTTLSIAYFISRGPYEHKFALASPLVLARTLSCPDAV